MNRRIIALALVGCQLLSLSAFAEEAVNLPFSVDFVPVQSFSTQGPNDDSNLYGGSAVGQDGSAEADTAVLATWHKSLENFDSPAQVTNPTIEDGGVMLKSAQGFAGRETNEKIETTKTIIPEFQLSLESLEALLQNDADLATAQCGCVVHYANEGKYAHRVGSVTTIGASKQMGLGLAQNGCLKTALTELKSKNPDWITLNSCHYGTRKIDEPTKKVVVKAIAEMKEKAKKMDHERAFAYTHKVTDILLSGLLGGVMWRARGGGFVTLPSTLLARLLFVGTGFSLIGYLDGGTDGAIAGALMLPGSFIGYWGVGMIVDTNHAFQDTAIMSTVGGLRTLLPAAYLNYKGYDATPMGLSGWAMGPCYYSAEQFLSLNSGFTSGYMAKVFDGQTSYAEACSGVAFGAGLALSIASKQPQATDLKTLDFDGLTGIVKTTEIKLIKGGVEDTLMEIVNYHQISASPTPAVPATASNRQLAKVCSKYHQADFNFSKPGMKALENLAEKDSVVKAQIYRMGHDPSASPYASGGYDFDIESHIANYYQQVCLLAGVVVTK